MPSRSALVAVAAMALVAMAFAAPARAQDSLMRGPLARGLDLEEQSRFKEAVAAYREALHGPAVVPALLGLERAWAELGTSDSLLPLLDTIIAARPRDPTVRSVQLRTLRAVGRPAELRAAFERWVRDASGDPAPYREYVRLLLQDGRAAAADSVLLRAQRTLGSARDLASETAQLRASMGLWEPAARSWREALEAMPYMAQAATFSLAPVPPTSRDAVRETLRAPPLALGARTLLASLELLWGSPRDAWAALAPLPASDSARDAWVEFATRAEVIESWLVARDALAAAVRWRMSAALALRASTDALQGGDGASALALATAAWGVAPDQRTAREALSLRVRALAQLARPDEAEAMVRASRIPLDEPTRAAMSRAVAWGWVRRGETGRARAVLAALDASPDDDVAGWLALYDGDLASARRALRTSTESTPSLVGALSLLTRTREVRSPAIGLAYLTLARGDTARAAAAFAAAATTVRDAAPLLLATAARLFGARRDDAAAVALWRSVVTDHASAPEAPEADLEWARALVRARDPLAAVTRLEHLILTYPDSALVPQARRELDQARAALPASS